MCVEVILEHTLTIAMDQFLFLMIAHHLAPIQGVLSGGDVSLHFCMVNFSKVYLRGGE